MSGDAAAAPEPDRPARRRPEPGDAADPPSGGPPSAPQPPPSAGAGDTHGQFLITSDERDVAEERLRAAVADEVLSLDEFGDRMRLLLAARTRAELHGAVAGLPTAARDATSRTAAPRAARSAPSHDSVVAVLSSNEVAGRWRPAPTTTAIAALGDARIDLQGAEYDGDELVIKAYSVLGSIEIIVPEGVDVELHGMSILGDRTVRTSGAPVPGAPVVRVDGVAVLGAVTVREPKPRERHAPHDGRGAFADRVPLPPGRERSTGARERTGTRLDEVRRFAGALLAAIALAVPLGWVATADDVVGSVFGSAQQAVTAQQLADGEASVGTPVLFGSVTVEVPDAVNVEQDGVMLFGSRECDACAGQAAADAPTVQIRTLGAFGSVKVVLSGAGGSD